MPDVLIVGYGVVGQHLCAELNTLCPDVYDPAVPKYAHKAGLNYKIAFLCVPTEPLADGRCDTSIVEEVVSTLDAELYVIKSTVPPGTTEMLAAQTGKRIVFSPEFYGVTQHAPDSPDFLILGGAREDCAAVAQLYGRVKNGAFRFLFADSKTAELAKYMVNGFLALKVAFCAEFYGLAEQFGVSYPQLRELFVADERVGCSHTLIDPDRPYYDSHCFNKDMAALVRFADSAPILEAAQFANARRKERKNNGR